MLKEIINAIDHNTAFWVCLICSIGLLIASFCVPPVGIISPSVLTGTGELFAFGALGAVYKALDKGTTATVKHGQTELEIKHKDNE